MASRNILKEITALRKRNLRGSAPYMVAMRRLRPTLDAIHLVASKKRTTVAEREFVRSVPLALVACMEGFFKHHAARLIDAGPPFLQNAQGFKDVRITLEGLVNTHTKRVTVGELLVHGMSISSLEDIDRIMSIVLGRPFLTTLKGNGLTAEYISAIATVFRKRHILAHELAPGIRVDVETAKDEAYAVLAILLSANMYIESRLDRVRKEP
jgi:hypothetical protein